MKLTQPIISILAISQLLAPSSSAHIDQTQGRRVAKSWSQKSSKGMQTKASKSSKGSRASSVSLVALLQGVGAGNEALVGTSTIRYNSDGSFLLALDVVGIESDEGTVVITDGTSCDGISETHFTNTDSFDGVVNAYQALDEGVSKSAFRFNSGYTRDHNLGKSVIMYDSENAIIGCGVLGQEAADKVLTASMGTYPNYDGDLEPSGTVTVTFHDDDTFKFHYNVNGLEADCEGCGIHIHAGLSCATHEEVLGHGWNSVVVQDLWTAAGGATYATDSTGKAEGYFELFNGYGYEENLHHAVVIHMSDGTRVGCGVLL